MRRIGLAAGLLCVASAASALTYTVTSTADTGAGSLRQAITDANTNPGADTIAFNIVGSGVHTITPATPLPPITGAVTIDGYTQSGSSPNTLPTSQGLNTVLRIEIDGTNTGATACLDVQADDVTIKGLAINRCPGIGILTTGAHQDLVVEGCFIGTNAAGTQALEPYGGGLQIRNHTNARIGGTVPAARNLVSGGTNGFPQIQLGDFAQDATGTVVAGNLIGTDVTGLSRFAQNGMFSIFLTRGSNNTIGGTSAGARNVLAGGEISLGGQIDGLEASNNLVQGNFLGIDVTGQVVLGCYGQCIAVNSRNNTIGGSAAGAGNRMGGTTGNAAIRIQGQDTLVQGNFIGTDPTGTVRTPNGNYGIMAEASNVTIGGTAAGEGNVIAYNGGWAGIAVVHSGITIRGNSIFDNPGDAPSNGLGIDLLTAGLGVTLNDAGDADTGPNNGQNFPVITSVTYGGASTTVAGTLNSTAATSFDLDFYADPVCSRRPQDLPEGKTYLGSVQVTTDGSGNAVFNEALPVAVPDGSPVTAHGDGSRREHLRVHAAIRPLADAPRGLARRPLERPDQGPLVRRRGDRDGRWRSRNRSRGQRRQHDLRQHPGPACGLDQRPDRRQPRRGALGNPAQRLDRVLQRRSAGPAVLRPGHQARRQRDHGGRGRRHLRGGAEHFAPADGRVPDEVEVRRLLRAARLHGRLRRRALLLGLRAVDRGPGGRGDHGRLRRGQLLPD